MDSEDAFDAPAGSVTALVGPSGSGKSTMCALIPRLYDVTQGAVRIDGCDIRAVTLRSLSAAIAVVPQDPFLFHSIAANLLYARPDADRRALIEACQAARIHHIIADLPQGYDTLVGERGYRFSGGEKQRLAIARALLRPESDHSGRSDVSFGFGDRAERAAGDRNTPRRSNRLRGRTQTRRPCWPPIGSLSLPMERFVSRVLTMNCWRGEGSTQTYSHSVR